MLVAKWGIGTQGRWLREIPTPIRKSPPLLDCFFELLHRAGADPPSWPSSGPHALGQQLLGHPQLRGLGISSHRPLARCNERPVLREKETRKRSLINGPSGSAYDPQRKPSARACCDAQ